MIKVVENKQDSSGGNDVSPALTLSTQVADLMACIARFGTRPLDARVLEHALPKRSVKPATVKVRKPPQPIGAGGFRVGSLREAIAAVLISAGGEMYQTEVVAALHRAGRSTDKIDAAFIDLRNVLGVVEVVRVEGRRVVIRWKGR